MKRRRAVASASAASHTSAALSRSSPAIRQLHPSSIPPLLPPLLDDSPLPLDEDANPLLLLDDELAAPPAPLLLDDELPPPPAPLLLDEEDELLLDEPLSS